MEKMFLTVIAANGNKIVINCDQGKNPVDGTGKLNRGSHAKSLQGADDDRSQLINDVVEKVTPTWRLDQMFTQANDLINGGTPEMTNMGLYMKLVNIDIVKEESDIIKNAGLEPKEIFKTVSIVARKFYFDRLNELAFAP